jgi:hypothetical protein
MLSRFNNEVLSKGPGAVLPQNLNHEWLNTLQTMAEDFLDSSYDLDECNKPEDVADPILSVCVLTILRSIEQPALENILSWDIIKRLKVSNPQFVETLEQACILREPKQSWFEKIKEKFL